MCSRPRQLAVLTVFTVWMERIAAKIEHSLLEKRNNISSFVTNACGLYNYFGFIHDNNNNLSDITLELAV